MRSIQLIAVFIVTIFSSHSAFAAVAGLPVELKGTWEDQIQNSAFEEMESFYQCDLSNLDSKDVTFRISSKELQGEEYAEYTGELSAFTLSVSASLPTSCNQAGRIQCKLKFNLYDEKAYDVDSNETACKEVK